MSGPSPTRCADVLDTLSRCAMTANEVADDVGATLPAVRNAIYKMRQRGLVVKVDDERWAAAAGPDPQAVTANARALAAGPTRWIPDPTLAHRMGARQVDGWWHPPHQVAGARWATVIAERAAGASLAQAAAVAGVTQQQARRWLRAEGSPCR